MTKSLEEIQNEIEKFLSDTGPLRAVEIRVRLDIPLPKVNEALGGDQDRFQKNPRTLQWGLNEGSDLAEVRPGPFGPARDLIPKNQVIQFASSGDSCEEILLVMAENQFSCIPVIGADDKVVGVFSYESFCSRIVNSQWGKQDPLQLPVKECMEAPRFIAPETYIDTTVDWSVQEAVLVGTPEELLGILTISDVWAALNDFAEGFVLLYEIERDLRRLIGRQLRNRLEAFLAELNSRRKSRKQPPVHELQELTFSEYEGALLGAKYSSEFQDALGVGKAILLSDFRAVNELRNAVFHFRKRVTIHDTRTLRRFLDKVQGAI